MESHRTSSSSSSNGSRPPSPPALHAPTGWADRPWWHSRSFHRVNHAAMMTRELLAWVKSEHPYWNRTGGSDHIWLFSHDEGACWAPAEIYNSSIILTHWGRTGDDHESGTSFPQVRGRHQPPALHQLCAAAGRRAAARALGCTAPPSKTAAPRVTGTEACPAPPRRHLLQDDYMHDVKDDPHLPGGYRQYIKGHPCYTPGKDFVLPSFEGPDRCVRGGVGRLFGCRA